MEKKNTKLKQSLDTKNEVADINTKSDGKIIQSPKQCGNQKATSKTLLTCWQTTNGHINFKLHHQKQKHAFHF
jgi:hypothetical protein